MCVFTCSKHAERVGNAPVVDEVRRVATQYEARVRASEGEEEEEEEEEN